MVGVVAECGLSRLIGQDPFMTNAPGTSRKALTTSGNWTREQLKLAFHFYCQTPFGKLHSRNPEIIELAKLIGRSPDALAMKLVNFASLDPSITENGRSGLKGASRLDREIWGEFNSDWEGLAVECDRLHQMLLHERGQGDVLAPDMVDRGNADGISDFTGETREAKVQLRVKQQFFRRSVLSSYRGRCCISGLSEQRLLVASHISPWRSDKANRLNPSNGLCLSAIHDKAFDNGLIALSDDFKVLVSSELLGRGDVFVEHVFARIVGQAIELPERFVPSLAFIRKHREECFKAR